MMNDKPLYEQLEKKVLELENMLSLRNAENVKQQVELNKNKEELERYKLKAEEIEGIFNQFLKNSPIYVFFKDSQIRILYLSSNYQDMLGVPSEKLIGKTMDEVFPSDLAKNMIADDLRILNEGKTIEIEEELNGRLYYSQKFPIHLKGKPGYLAGYTIDITERRRSEIVIQHQNQELKELNATKDKLFSLIAHDLRSPFNSILGYSELIIDEAKIKRDVDTAALAAIIRSSANSTLYLLDNLLEWAKSQTGEINFKPEYLNLSDVVKEMIEIFKPTAKIKNISLNFFESDKIEVYADQNMLRTILRNLIHNAVKFTNTNGKIEICYKRVNDNILITVSDNGVGMNTKMIGKLFKPDSSITTPGTAQERGSGLGLLMCKEFIDKHCGKIWVVSEVSKGSDFNFTLPLPGN